MARIKKWWARFQETALWRAWQRYGNARGNLLAGGVTYFAFFSIFPLIALAVTVFGFVLRNNQQWLDAIRDYLNTLLPGFVGDGTTGLLTLEPPSSTALSWAGALALGGLLWAGLGWLGALRDGIRTVFGASGEPGNAVTLKLRDLGVLVLLGAAIAISAAVTALTAGAAAALVGGLGVVGDILVKIIGVVVGIALDSVIVAIMLRILSGERVPWRGVRNGALAGGIGLTALKLAGTSLLGAMNNPLFTSIALVVGLLVWLNFISRIVLLAAAWAANDLDAAQLLVVSEGVEAKLREGPMTQAEAYAAGSPLALPGPDDVAGVGVVGGPLPEGGSGGSEPGSGAVLAAYRPGDLRRDLGNAARGALAGAVATAATGLWMALRRRRRSS